MERINDMVDFGLPVMVQDGNDIKADIQTDFMLIIIGRCGLVDMGTFLTIDGHFRGAIIIILTCLHLNKDNVLAINGDNIDFLAISTPIAFQYLIAFVDKILCCQLFSYLAQ